MNRIVRLTSCCGLAAAALGACRASDSPGETMSAAAASVASAPFGAMPDGTPVRRFTLVNDSGMTVRIMTYGATITSLEVPDRHGELGDVVLGYDSLAGYLASSPYFGAIVGRYGNRIARGKFTLDGRSYSLAINNPPNSLHGGDTGFDKRVWGAEPVETDSTVGVRMTLTSRDGEEGYPGTLRATVTYALRRDRNALAIDYQATTDKATPVNLTNHSYFNLGGASSGDILGHLLTLHADSMTPVDNTLIPTGAITPVEGTPFDFRTPMAIGARIAAPDSQLAHGGGYDHNFVVNRTGPGLVPVATVTEPASGRTLTISSTEPGVQFYSGNFLDGTLTGKGGVVYKHRAAFCLETQHYPDSPNQAGFPSTILRPGDTLRSRTVWVFGTVP